MDLNFVTSHGTLQLADRGGQAVVAQPMAVEWLEGDAELKPVT